MRKTISPWSTGVLLLMVAAVLPGEAARAASQEQPVSVEVQDKVIAVIGRQLVKPETARWVFDFIRPDPGGGQIICGKVDYQDSTKKFLGAHRFFVTYSGGKVRQMALESTDPTRNRSLDTDFAALCDRK